MRWPGYDLTQLHVVQGLSWLNSDFDCYKLTQNPADPLSLLPPIFIKRNRMSLSMIHQGRLVCIDMTWLDYDFEQVRVDLITSCLTSWGSYELTCTP